MKWGDSVKVLQVPRSAWKKAWGAYPESQALAGRTLTVMWSNEEEGLTLLYIAGQHGDMDVVWPTRYLLNLSEARVQ